MQTDNSDPDHAGKSATTSGKEGGGGNVDTMLDFNALQYNMYPDLSVVTERTYKTSPFQKGSYESTSSGTAICVLNTGSDFIDGRNSYLSFELKIGEPTENGTGINATRGLKLDSRWKGYRWGHGGSACNLIKSVAIYDRAGNELERVDEVGRLANLLMRWNNSEEYLKTVGGQFNNPNEFDKFSSAGTQQMPQSSKRKLAIAADTVNTVAGAYPTEVCHMVPQLNGGEHATSSYRIGNGRKWVIPLRLLSGLFDYDQLLPSQLMSGLRIHIEWEDSELAMEPFNMNSRYAGYSYKYEVLNCQLVCDCVKLTDSVMRELNERSANNGLEIVYRTWFSTSYQPDIAAASIHLESRKAVSRAFGAFAAFYRSYAFDYDKMGRSHFETIPYMAKSWQWRAGNLYFPQQPVISPSYAVETNDTGDGDTDVMGAGKLEPGLLSGARETYAHTLRFFNKQKDHAHPPYVGIENIYDRIPSAQQPRYLDFEHNVDVKAASVKTGFIYKPQFGVFPCDLERSTVQDLSGIPLNNSRVLAFNYKKDDGRSPNWSFNGDNSARKEDVNVFDSPDTVFPNTGSGDSFEVIIFMQYLKVARVFLDNTEIEE